MKCIILLIFILTLGIGGGKNTTLDLHKNLDYDSIISQNTPLIVNYLPIEPIVKMASPQKFDLTLLNAFHSRIKYPQDKKIVVFLGDSRIVLMYDTYTFPGNSFSFAMGSSTSIGVINRLQNLYKLKDMGYDITNIMLQFGVNDITQSNGNDHEINFKKNFDEIISILKKDFSKAHIVVGDIITYDIPYDGKFDQAYQDKIYNTIDDSNRFLKEYCLANHISYFEANNEFSKKDNHLKEKYNDDGIHFSKEGYRYLMIEFIKRSKSITF